jgi:hypothetical protein
MGVARSRPQSRGRIAREDPDVDPQRGSPPTQRAISDSAAFNFSHPTGHIFWRAVNCLSAIGLQKEHKTHRRNAGSVVRHTSWNRTRLLVRTAPDDIDCARMIRGKSCFALLSQLTPQRQPLIRATTPRMSSVTPGTNDCPLDGSRASS